MYLRLHPPAALNVYAALADGLVRTGSLAIDGQPTTQFEPMYPAFIAAARVVLRAPALVDVAQVLVAAAGVLLLYRLTMTLTGDSRVAAIAAALFACDPLLVREAVGHSESGLLTTLLIAFAYAFVRMADATGAATAGAWLGLAMLTRTTTVPLLVLAPAVLAARRAWLEAVVLGATALLIMSPLPLRIHAIDGGWWPTRSGVNLYIGNSPRTAALLPHDDPDLLQLDADRLVHERLPNVDALPAAVSERTIDALLTREALGYMAADPARTIGQKIVNVAYLFSPRVVPYRPDAQPRPVGEVVVWAIFSSVLTASALAGVYARRKGLAVDAVLWCIAATVVGVAVAYVPATRYRAPMEFVLVFYAAVAWQLRSRRSVAAMRRCVASSRSG